MPNSGLSRQRTAGQDRRQKSSGREHCYKGHLCMSWVQSWTAAHWSCHTITTSVHALQLSARRISFMVAISGMLLAHTHADAHVYTLAHANINRCLQTRSNPRLNRTRPHAHALTCVRDANVHGHTYKQTSTHACTQHARTCTRTGAFNRARMHTRIRPRMSMPRPMRKGTHTDAHAQAHEHTQAHSHAQARRNTRPHTYAREGRRACTHAGKRARTGETTWAGKKHCKAGTCSRTRTRTRTHRNMPTV